MGKQVFEGIKVADFSWAIAGPTITRYLAEHGADVIHIESGSYPDQLRAAPPFKGGVRGVNRAGYFASFNSNKRGIIMNLNYARGVELAKKIVAWADIVVENYRPGVMDRWGLGYTEVKKIKPDIIMVSTSNQGQTGPAAQQAGQGTQLTALAGFLNITGWPDGEPRLPYGPYTDVIAPRFGIPALVAAMAYRRKTGKGQYIDLSQYETALHFLAPLVLDYTVNGRVARRIGNRSSCAAPHGAYPCLGTDRWVVIAIFSTAEWQILGKEMGNPPWAGDPKFATVLGRKRNEDELDALVAGWTINRTAEEVMTRLQAAGVKAGVVKTCEEVLADPQLTHRHQFRQLEHSEIGKYRCQGPAFKLSKTPSEVTRPAPCLGQDNEYVYTKLLGLSDEEFVELLGSGVINWP